MAVIRNTFPFSYSAGEAVPSGGYSYYICDTDAEIGTLVGKQGDLAFSKESNTLYKCTDSLTFTSVDT